MTDVKAPPAAAAGPTEGEQRKTLEAAIITLERENKSLRGQLDSFSPAALEELKKTNKELKTALIQIEKDLAAELTQRKNPLDATGISDKLQILKSSTLAFCADRQLDPAIWKNLESL